MLLRVILRTHSRPEMKKRGATMRDAPPSKVIPAWPNYLAFSSFSPAFFQPEIPADMCLIFLYPSLDAASAAS